MVKITKVDFFKAYDEGDFATHQKICGKKLSLDKEIYLLRKFICQETITSDGRRLYRIATQIFTRYKRPNFCQKVITLFKNALNGRGFSTPASIYKDILQIGKKAKFHTYEHSQEARGQKRNKFKPRKLSFSSK